MKESFLKYLLASLLIWSSTLTLFAQEADFSVNKPITAENALESYIELEDGAFDWELKESFNLEDVIVHHLLFTSQNWRDHMWRHQLTLFVPEVIEHDGALLFITGGSNKDEQPNWSERDRMWPSLATMAKKNKAIVTVLKQTPNQPLYGNKTEDELISFTFHNFMSDKDYTWPLLFPMVKSVVKAMDAVQEFSGLKLGHEINDFVITGASKRGWTTWLSAAVGDDRVKAIAPMVIDILNMPVNLQYQLDSYGEYSKQIEDYVKLGIVQSMATDEGKELTTMIDPYSYKSKLRVPKLIIMGTNDPYWTVDAIKHYYNDIPGKNMIHYVPNVGHDLGGGKQALESLSAFFAHTLLEKPYPLINWNIVSGQNSAKLTIHPQDTVLLGVILWSATSTDPDFRDEKWTNKSLREYDTSTIEIEETYPKEGYKAFYVDLIYRDPNGDNFTVSTRIFMMDAEVVL